MDLTKKLNLHCRWLFSVEASFNSHSTCESILKQIYNITEREKEFHGLMEIMLDILIADSDDLLHACFTKYGNSIIRITWDY